MVDITRDADRLATLGSYDLMDTPPEPPFDIIVAQSAELANAPISLISLLDDRREWFKAKRGTDLDGLPLDQSICIDVLRSGATYVVPDAAAHEVYRNFPLVRDGLIRFYAGVPLTLKSGVSLGSLCVIDVAPRAALDVDERRALEALARRTVAAFELRREIRAQAAAEARLKGAGSTEHRVWLDRASDLLAQASAALDQIGAASAAAHLEHVIAMVDELRDAPAPEQPESTRPL